MSASRPRALLVDFGGVLTTNIWQSFKAFSDAEGLDPESIKDSFRGDGSGILLLRRLEKGEIADADFEVQFGELLGVAPDDLISRMFAGLRPDEKVIAAVAAVKATGVPTGLISNSWGTGIYDRAPLHLFDATVISGDVGLHKPQPDIYHLGAERLGVPAGDCVFVDDLRENIDGAEAVGMKGVLHRDSDETVATLERLFGPL